jgi:hypothetical protein
MQPQQPPYVPPQQPVPTPPYTQQPPVANYPHIGQPVAPTPDYDFIMQQDHKPKTNLLGTLRGGSMPSRIALVLGGLLVLVVIAILIKNVLGGGQAIDVPAMVSVSQDQQELLHLFSDTTNITGNQTLSISNQNFVATGQLAISSEQSQLISYLKENGHKISTTQLGLKISSTVDNQITASVTASTYDSTFIQIMQTELATYKQDLAVAYNNTKGPRGRALLKSDYAGAVLLIKQINSPDS